LASAWFINFPTGLLNYPAGLLTIQDTSNIIPSFREE